MVQKLNIKPLHPRVVLKSSSLRPSVLAFLCSKPNHYRALVPKPHQGTGPKNLAKGARTQKHARDFIGQKLTKGFRGPKHAKGFRLGTLGANCGMGPLWLKVQWGNLVGFDGMFGPLKPFGVVGPL